MLDAAIIVIDVFAAFALIALILLHSGKGSGLSDMFGGASSLSGGTAMERRLDKITVGAAIVFGLCTFWLSWKWT
jgi:preprotein translocase subunit SecG